MCGRFTLKISIEVLIEIFGISEFPSYALQPRFNIAPTQQIPAVRQYADYTDHIDLLRWGFYPFLAARAPLRPTPHQRTVGIRSREAHLPSGNQIPSMSYPCFRFLRVDA